MCVNNPTKLFKTDYLIIDLNKVAWIDLFENKIRFFAVVDNFQPQITFDSVEEAKKFFDHVYEEWYK